MFRLSLRRPALVLTLAVFLVTPGEVVAGPRLPGVQLRAFSDSINSGFLSFFSKFWEKAGCKLDPHGQCLPSTIDNGCGIDPDGRCVPVKVDNGCSLDPNGRCMSGQ
jgi:hypothetical protein